MFKSYTLAFSTAILLVAGLLIGCSNDSTGPKEPSIEEAVVVGTQVDSDFKETGQFEVLGTPLDENREGVISDAVQAEITLDSLSGDPSSKQARQKSRVVFGKDKVSDISANIISQQRNQPGNDPFAVTLNIDGSGSMSWNDENRTRVAGAKDFVDQFEQNVNNFDINIFTFPGDPAPSSNFSDSELLAEFTDDATVLKNSVEEVQASGGTPTYPSLLEILDYSEQERPTQSNERALVLFSDGSPNSTSQRSDACDKANNMDSPIYAIGLGPASDLSNNPDQQAVEEMRRIATCTGGSYAGIDPNNTSVDASSLYQNIAVGTSKGNIQYSVELTGSGFDSLQSGTILYFTLTLQTNSGQADAFFSFSVPSN